MAQATKILNLLETGNQFTPSQLASIVGTSQDVIRARVADLRNEGHCVYTNITKAGKKTYRLGKPSRTIVAAAAKAYGGRLFSTVE